MEKKFNNDLPSVGEINKEDINIENDKNNLKEDIQINNNKMDGIDLESLNENNEIEIKIRMNFIKKVYGIITIQLIITFGIVLLFQIELLKEFILNHGNLVSVLITLSSIILVVIYIIIICNRNLGREVPYNYILLFFLTLSAAFICSALGCLLSLQIVIFAIALVIATSIVITVYASTTKTDFTISYVVLFILLGQIIVSFVFYFFIHIKIIYILTCILGCFTFGIYLVYDTQKIMGNYGMTYQIDDYILAAIDIYVDIIQIFIEILKLLIRKKN